MMVAVDAGHGYVKGVSSRGQRVLMPSLIAPAPEMVDLGGLARSAITTIGSTAYVVGEAARQTATPLWSHDKAADDETLNLILVAAAQLGASGPTRLATGLPLAWFGAQRTSFKDALTGFGQTVVTADGVHTKLWFDSVVVLPQGVAASGPILTQDQYAPGPYLVADVGYRTTDYIVVTKTDQGLTYDAAAAGSLPLGMHAVDEKLAQRLSREHQTTFTAAQIAGQPAVVAHGQTWDLTLLRAEQERQVARAILQALVEKLDSRMEQVLGLVSVGGGSQVFASVPHVIVPPEPQWANAQGYLSAIASVIEMAQQVR